MNLNTGEKRDSPFLRKKGNCHAMLKPFVYLLQYFLNKGYRTTYEIDLGAGQNPLIIK